MSCFLCDKRNQNSGEDQYPCICDRFVHPFPLNIGAGLDRLPRQIATFPEFRRAMLKSVRTEQVEIIDNNNMLVKIIPLVNLRARDKDDLGIMLLEMWAYICDSLSFYDEVIANEAYLRTSSLRPNLRRLIALLGYLPRPAVGSVVELAALAEGRLQLRLPAGTAFRSGAFNGNPPQVFELDNDTYIHPLTNRFGIVAPHAGKVLVETPDSVLVNLSGDIKEDSLLLLINTTDSSQTGGVVVKKLEKLKGIDNRKYINLIFTSETKLKKDTLLENLQVLKSTLTAGLWTVSATSESLNANKITLNVLSHQIKAEDYILMVCQDEKRWFRVSKVTEVMRYTMPSGEIVINGNKFVVPGITVPVTELELDVSVNSSLRKSGGSPDWSPAICGNITVYFGMQVTATIIDEPNATLSAADPLCFNDNIEKPVDDFTSSRFILQDKNTYGLGMDGSISYEQKKLVPDTTDSWPQKLTLPVDVYGNAITASRGEKVDNEVLGSGDTSLSNQTFKLKKKPLTYQLLSTSKTDQLVKSTLSVYVNGILWTEADRFYGKSEKDEIYIVRQNDEGESLVTFGNGIRGQRLPSGAGNVICSYRFGAEAACPPSGSVTQISKPVKGLKSVKNILPAFGGADAEDAEDLRTYAPKSALLLGRVVSMKDMQALAESYPGVRAVQTEWRWDKLKQCASAHIYYIGDIALKTGLSEKIRSFADPSTPITVEKAESNPLFLSLNIKINEKYRDNDIIREIRSTLLDVKTGLLAPENISIGIPLYRSKIFEAVLNVDGTETVQGIYIGSDDFSDFAVVPGTGMFFDIEQGSLIINGTEN